MRSLKAFVSAFAALLLLQNADGLKILVYSPRMGRSHVMFTGRIADTLAEAGHEVVLFQPVIRLEVANLTGTKHCRIIERWPTFELKEVEDITSFAWDPNAGSFSQAIKTLGNLGSMFKQSCEDVLRDTAMMDRLKAEKFDIGISEFFDICGHGIFRRIGLNKTIVLYAGAMPLDDATFFGLPASTSFVYDFISQDSLDGFWSRFKSFMGLMVGRHYLMKKFIGRTAEAYRVFNKTLDYRQLIAESSYAFVNTDEYLDVPRPITHKYINIAGLGMRKAIASTGTLDEKYKKIFDSAKRGVIYFSLGTVAQSWTMPEENKRAFLEAFAEFPDIHFLWKYEKPEHKIADGYKNVFAFPWMPQKEILGHSKILAFITHGGANSQAEASYAGVPVISIPLFGDQVRNSLVQQERGIGVLLEKTALTKENIVEAIRKVVETPDYKRRAQELSAIIRNKPMSPEDRLIKHVEFAAKYDIHASLDMHGRHLSTIEYYNIDIIAAIFSALAILLLILFLVVRLALRVLCRLMSGGGSKAKSDLKRE